jgi:hypothetical protein
MRVRPRSKRLALLKFVLWAILLALIPSYSISKQSQKKDKFRGTVVFAGPKAITVKSEQNIYLVRTFNYTPQLERKIQSKKPAQGKKVTVYYLRGTDVALKVN